MLKFDILFIEILCVQQFDITQNLRPVAEIIIPTFILWALEHDHGGNLRSKYTYIHI